LNLYTKYTEMVLKSTWVKVFPSTVNSIKDIRGYFSCKYIWVDESDYVPENVVDELIHAITPYQTKSNAKIVLSSTAFKPNGLMQSIELDSKSKYFKLKLPYQLGLNFIYDSKDIELRKNDVEFKREFELQYVGKQGNVFTQQQIDLCQELGKQFSTDKITVSPYTLKSVGVDFGFSSSATAIVCMEHMKNVIIDDKKVKEDLIRVTDCYLLEKSTPDQVIETCWNIHKKYGFFNVWFLCDASNAGVINQMKIRWGENIHWQKVEDVHPQNAKIIPVAFSVSHKQMLSHLHSLVSKGLIAIDPKYDKLITSLKTAWANEQSLDKKQTSYDDLLDGARLATKAFLFK